MIKIVNKHRHNPNENETDIYIGRGSVLGNPYTSISDKQTKAKYITNSREESIEFYEIYLREKIKEKDKVICSELNRLWLLSKTKDLNFVCFCSPKKCHGDIIKKIIEEV